MSQPGNLVGNSWLGLVSLCQIWDFYARVFFKYPKISNNGNLLFFPVHALYKPRRATLTHFCWVCATGLSDPHPIIVYLEANYYRPHLNHFFWANVLYFTNSHVFCKFLEVFIVLHPKIPKMCKTSF